MEKLAHLRDKALTARSECWLIIGLFIFDLGAAVPFGVSSGLLDDLTPFEWAASGALIVLAFGMLVGMFSKPFLSHMSLIGGMVWAAVAAGTFSDGIVAGIPLNAQIALLLMPVGMIFAHLSLERYVERPHNRRIDDE